MNRNLLVSKIIPVLSILLAWIISASAQNTVSFDNQSGEPTLVKLIGPTSSEIEVPNGTKPVIQVLAGKYFIKVRYGVEGKLKPDSAEAYYNRGNAKDNKGDSDGAIADYSKAIELKPDYANAYYNRGVAKQAKSDLDGAIADYSKAIELKPDFAQAYYNRGYAKQAKGDLDGAFADFTKAIKLKPDFAGAYKPDYAEAYNTRGVAKQAKGDL